MPSLHFGCFPNNIQSGALTTQVPIAEIAEQPVATPCVTSTTSSTACIGTEPVKCSDQTSTVVATADEHGVMIVEADHAAYVLQAIFDADINVEIGSLFQLSGAERLKQVIRNGKRKLTIHRILTIDEIIEEKHLKQRKSKKNKYSRKKTEGVEGK